MECAYYFEFCRLCLTSLGVCDFIIVAFRSELWFQASYAAWLRVTQPLTLFAFFQNQIRGVNS